MPQNPAFEISVFVFLIQDFLYKSNWVKQSQFDPEPDTVNRRDHRTDPTQFKISSPSYRVVKPFKHSKFLLIKMIIVSISIKEVVNHA